MELVPGTRFSGTVFHCDVAVRETGEPNKVLRFLRLIHTVNDSSGKINTSPSHDVLSEQCCATMCSVEELSVIFTFGKNRECFDVVIGKRSHLVRNYRFHRRLNLENAYSCMTAGKKYITDWYLIKGEKIIKGDITKNSDYDYRYFLNIPTNNRSMRVIVRLHRKIVLLIQKIIDNALRGTKIGLLVFST